MEEKEAKGKEHKADAIPNCLLFPAVCRDRLFPYINRFARGHGPNDEPRQALFLASVIAVVVILIGGFRFGAPHIIKLCTYLPSLRREFEFDCAAHLQLLPLLLCADQLCI